VPGVVYPSSRAQSERTIAVARIALAATALLAVWMDPAEPERYADLTFTLYWVYIIYSVVLGLWTIRWEGGDRLPLVTHGIDIIAFSLFQYLTLGPSSPFFMYFVFSTFCGAIRWGWRGTLATGATVVAAYLAMVVSINQRLVFEGFELNRFLVRLAYLVVSTGMLVYLGRYEARLRLEIERLARWPAPIGPDVNMAIGRILEYAGRLMQARSVLVLWEVRDAPGLHEAMWADGTTTRRHHRPGAMPVLADGAPAQATFICTGPAREAQSYLVADHPGRLIRHNGSPLSPAVLDRVRGEGIASAPFETDRLHGRVFFSDFGAPPSEAVPLTEVVAREIASSLDQLHSSEQRQELATREERIRVARDLHDGVLQGLTGVRLELRAIANALTRAADEGTRDQLVSLERALAMEQRELRFFISGLEPGADQRIDRASPLAQRLDTLRERLALEWKTPVTLRVSLKVSPLPDSLDEAVPLMVHEATVNALKHGQPSRVAVDVESTAGQLRIVVTDDGRGFPFAGTYSHERLAASQAAPRTLFERVTALGGRLSIESSTRGSRVEMLLPCQDTPCPFESPSQTTTPSSFTA